MNAVGVVSAGSSKLIRIGQAVLTRVCPNLTTPTYQS